MNPLQALARAQPIEQPCATLLWQAAVEIGQRFIIPITGGMFWGGPGHEDLHGMVRPGGADRQLLRPDGITELDALYEMRLHDGAVLTIRNRVTIDEARQPRYARSVLQVTAPEGPWAWLNRRCPVGSLHSLRPQAAAVLVSVFELG